MKEMNNNDKRTLMSLMIVVGLAYCFITNVLLTISILLAVVITLFVGASQTDEKELEDMLSGSGNMFGEEIVNMVMAIIVEFVLFMACTIAVYGMFNN